MVIDVIGMSEQVLSNQNTPLLEILHFERLLFIYAIYAPELSRSTSYSKMSILHLLKSVYIVDKV